MRRILLAAFIAAAGCSQSATSPPDSAAAGALALGKDYPAFKSAVFAYTAEAKALAKFLESDGNLELFAKTRLALGDLASRIPDVPNQDATITKRLDELKEWVSLTGDTLTLYFHSAARLEDRPDDPGRRKEANERLASVNHVRARIKAAIKALEDSLP